MTAASYSFLFTDIEGSTARWEERAGPMAAAVSRHDELLRRAVEEHQGRVFKGLGDGFCCVFPDTAQALQAAVESQKAIRDEKWGEAGPIQVRMAVHSGAAQEREGDYFGPAVNRVARLLAAGHGGQVLVSAAVSAAVSAEGEATLPAGASLLELGSYRLRGLPPEPIFQLVHPSLGQEFPPLHGHLPSGNLPLALTSFVGRQQELQQVQEMLARHRLVTLWGTGGAGKTRLALETAAAVQAGYPDGVWLVELAPITEPDLIPSALASLLGIKDTVSCMDTLVDLLKPMTALIILDNCEHLIHDGASFAQKLLERCAGLKILATSRERLGVNGESVFSVPLLPLPGTDTLSTNELMGYAAVRLFVERAACNQASLSLTPENIPTILAISRRLEGMPLAIELAAARYPALSLQQIAEGLARELDLCSTGRAAALPHHRALMAAIDWSYELLSEAERALLRRLAVFNEPWTLESAAATCATDSKLQASEVRDLHAQLVAKSLVTMDEAPGLPTRYHFLDTIRQYARQKLDEAGEATTTSKSLERFLEPYQRAPTLMAGSTAGSHGTVRVWAPSKQTVQRRIVTCGGGIALSIGMIALLGLAKWHFAAIPLGFVGAFILSRIWFQDRMKPRLLVSAGSGFALEALLFMVEHFSFTRGTPPVLIFLLFGGILAFLVLAAAASILGWTATANRLAQLTLALAALKRQCYLTTDDAGIGITTWKGSRSLPWPEILRMRYDGASYLVNLATQSGEPVSFNVAGYPDSVRGELLSLIQRKAALTSDRDARSLADRLRGPADRFMDVMWDDRSLWSRLTGSISAVRPGFNSLILRPSRKREALPPSEIA